MNDEQGTGWSVVTGAAGGIGLEIVRLFARRGPVLAIDRDDAALLDALDTVESAGHRIEPAIADVSSPSDVARAFASLPEDFSVRCLVNCAAIFDHQKAEIMTLDAWERVLKINLTGPFLCSQAAFPRMGPRIGRRQYRVHQRPQSHPDPCQLCGIQGRAHDAHPMPGGRMGAARHTCSIGQSRASSTRR